MNEPQPPDQEQMVDSLIAELLEKADRGEQIDEAQFLEKHAEYAEELKSYFEDVSFLQQLSSTHNLRSEAEATITSSPEAENATEQTSSEGHADSETSVSKTKATTSSTSISIPDSFGRYAIQKVLGQGAMGAVYLAKDTQLDRDVALKIPKFDDNNGVDDEELMERFYREARAAATLRSPNICPVYDVGEIDGQHYITMAYIEGRPLKDFTKSKKTHSEKQIITTIRKLALGLAEAHDIGVVHRDLKPANIMVDKRAEPVVMDFGLARRSASDDVQVTQSGAILGTPAYMAPEQVAGDQTAIDHRVDIYALGIIMYELITGEMPFKGNLMAILQQIALNNPTKPSDLREDIDPRLETICLKMMAGDQTKRYQKMDEVAKDLQKVLRSPKSKGKGNESPNPKPKTLPTATEESNPALISVKASDSLASKLKNRGKTLPPRRNSNAAKKSASSAGMNLPPKKWLMVGGIGGLVLLLGIIFFARIGKYDVQIIVDDPSIKISIDGGVLNIEDGDEVIRLSAGEHKLKLEKDGLEAEVESFTVTKDGENRIQVKMIEGLIAVLKNGEEPEGLHIATTPNAKNQKSSPATNKTPGPSNQPTNSSLPNVKVTKANSVPTSGNALQFTPGDGVVIDSLKDTTKSLTMECWIRLDKLQSNIYLLGPSKNYCLTIGDTRHLSFKGVKGTQPNQAYLGQRDKKTQKDRWYHLAIVRDADAKQHRLYVNGQLDSQVSRTVPLSNTSFQICGTDRQYAAEKGVGFYGQLDEIRISSSVRYKGDSFTPQRRFEPDDDTVALYHFDEGSGDIAKDSSGHGHDGKITGAKWVANDSRIAKENPSHGIENYALQFEKVPEGTPRHIVKVPSLKESGETLTMEVWVSEPPISNGKYRKQTVTANSHIVGFSRHNIGGGTGTYEFKLGVIPDVEHGLVTIKVPGKAMRFTGPVHLASVRDKEQGEYRFYLNGELVDRRKIDLPLNGDFLTFGDGYAPFQGWIAEARISSVARYHEDFTPERRFPNEPGTIALYHFDEGSGDILKDSSGNEHHGKITGAKWIGSQLTHWQPTPEQQTFIETVAKLQPQQQVVAVSQKLKELNSGFDGKVKHVIENNRVVELEFLSNDVTDLSPVRAFAHLEQLNCDSRFGTKSILTDLSPLQGMKLKTLRCSFTPVADLSPLQGMPLTELHFGYTQVADLSPLRGMPLTKLICNVTRVADLSPLEGMRLTYLKCMHTQIEDLSPLKNMPLKDLLCNDDIAFKNSQTLRAMETLKTINGKLAEEYWQEVGRKNAETKRMIPDSQSAVITKPAVAPFNETQAIAHQEDWAKHLSEEVVTTNSLGMKLAVIPPGEFKMGEGDNVADVTLTMPFRLGVHEVTQGQWKAVMETEPWKGKEQIQDGENFPATYVAWEDVTEFCRKLTERERTAGRLASSSEYRLPTEAEWEWACRAGTTTTYSFGDDESQMGEYAWYESNTKNAGETYAHAVGLKRPNGWGLHDMHGNVWEWCRDWRGAKLEGGTDPVGPSQGAHRVPRGGSWSIAAENCRSANRGGNAPSLRLAGLGFRVVLSPSQNAAKTSTEPKESMKSEKDSLTTTKKSSRRKRPELASSPFSARAAKQLQKDWAEYLEVEAEYTNPLGVKFVLIPPGDFDMGTNQKQLEYLIGLAKQHGEGWEPEYMVTEFPQRRVKITKPFYMSVHEVTKFAWVYFSTAKIADENTKPPKASPGDDLPATNISYEEMVEFCKWFSTGEKKVCRLPTEAEWEYGCRAGTETLTAFGDDLSSTQANFHGNFPLGNAPKGPNLNKATSVGSYPPNAFGLYDMHGNAWEVVSDYWHENTYRLSPNIDPTGPAKGSQRVIRGGDYENSRGFAVRSGLRFTYALPYKSVGFRIVLELD